MKVTPTRTASKSPYGEQEITRYYYEFNNQSKKVQEKCGFKPYRKLMMETRLGTKEQGILNLLTNPNKNIKLMFSHHETLIYNQD